MLTDILGSLKLDQTSSAPGWIVLGLCGGCALLCIYYYILMLKYEEDVCKNHIFFLGFISIGVLAICSLYYVTWMFTYRADLLDYWGLLGSVITITGSTLFTLVQVLSVGKKDNKKTSVDIWDAMCATLLFLIVIPVCIVVTAKHYNHHYFPSIQSQTVKTIRNAIEKGKRDQWNLNYVKSISFDKYTRSGDDANGLGLIYFTSGKQFNQKAYKAFQIACHKFQHSYGCTNLGIMTFEKEIPGKTMLDARKVLEHACKLNSVDGCYYHVLTYNKDPNRFEIQKRDLGKACKQLKSAENCLILANFFHSMKLYKQSTQYVVKAWEHSRWNSQELNQAVMLITQYLRKAKQEKNQLDKKLLKIAMRHIRLCKKPEEKYVSHGSVNCYLKGAMYRDGIAVDRDLKKAYMFLRKACLLGVNDACFEIYEMVKARESSNITFVKAEKLRKYSCIQHIKDYVTGNIGNLKVVLCKKEIQEFKCKEDQKLPFCKQKKKLALRTKH